MTEQLGARARRRRRQQGCRVCGDNLRPGDQFRLWGRQHALLVKGGGVTTNSDSRLTLAGVREMFDKWKTPWHDLAVTTTIVDDGALGDVAFLVLGTVNSGSIDDLATRMLAGDLRPDQDLVFITRGFAQQMRKQAGGPIPVSDNELGKIVAYSERAKQDPALQRRFDEWLSRNGSGSMRNQT